MEANLPEARAASGRSFAPQNVRTPSFAASKRERVAAVLMYFAAYLYIETCFRDQVSPFVWAAFTVSFVALAEYLYRGTPRARESWVWLACTAAVLCSIVWQRARAWAEGMPIVFLHIFAVWWALSRSGALLDGESGRLLPLDALNGFLVFPFKNFFLRARTMGFSVACLRGEKRRGKPCAETVLRTALAVAAALGLLIWAINLLTRADVGFYALIGGVLDRFRFAWNVDVGEFLIRFLLSLPVGAYLYGLLGGTLREDKAALRERAANVENQVEALRGVPERVWTILLGLFCALYALFFVVQGRYLFGAFVHALPDGFNVAAYARQGFFELCKVMAVNFALLWLVTRSSKIDVREQRATRALCLVLLAESLLFAVVAFSKLALYIGCFGFTPKRLQSTWLVCVLAFGALCAIWSLVRNQKTFRAWMVFGAVTLSLLCLY